MKQASSVDVAKREKRAEALSRRAPRPSRRRYRLQPTNPTRRRPAAYDLDLPAPGLPECRVEVDARGVAAEVDAGHACSAQVIGRYPGIAGRAEGRVGLPAATGGRGGLVGAGAARLDPTFGGGRCRGRLRSGPEQPHRQAHLAQRDALDVHLGQVAPDVRTATAKPDPDRHAQLGRAALIVRTL